MIPLIRKQPRVLVVDDSEDMRDYLIALFADQGYRVWSAAEGETALRLVREQKPDLVLLDVILPGLTGLQVCRRIKSDPELSTVFVALVSAVAISTENKLDGSDAGADDYILKPFKAEEVLVRVQSLLRIQQSFAALRDSEARWQSLVENAPNFIYTIDAAGQIEYQNRPFPNSGNDATAANIFDLTFPEYHDRMRQAFQRALTSGLSASFETAALGVNGRIAWYAGRVGPVRSSTGPAKLIVIATDITSRKRAEDELSQLNQQLEQRVADRTARLLNANQSLQEEIRIREQIEASLLDRKGLLLRQNQALRELAGFKVGGGPDTAPSWRHFLATAQPALVAARTRVWLVDRARARLWVVAEWPESPPPALMEISLSGEWQALLQQLETGGVLASVPGTPPGAELPLPMRLRDIAPDQAMLCAPLRSGGVLVGLFTVEDTDAQRTWTAEEEAFAGALAGLASLGIEESELRRAEQASRESEARLRLALHAAKMGIWHWDVRTGQLTYSSQLGQTFGLAEGAAHSTVDELLQEIHPEDRERVRLALQQALVEDVDYAVQFRLMRAGEPVQWVASRGRVEHDAQGQPVGMLGVAINITDQKRAEADRLASEARFRKLLEGVPNVGVLGFSPEGVIHYWNRANEIITGYRAEEAVGSNLFELLLPADQRDALRATFDRGLSTGEMPAPAECIIQRKDGQPVTLLNSYALVRAPGCDPEFFCLRVDLTERNRAEQRTRENEERLRLALLAARMVTWQWDIVSDRFTFSEPLPENFGLGTPDTAVNRQRFFTAVHADDRSELERRVEAALQGSAGFEAEFRIVPLQGSEVWVSASGSLHRNALGRPLHLLGVAVDITERKRSADALRELSGRVIAAQESERRRVARELHDSVSQILGSVRFRLHAIESNLPARNPRLAGQVEQIKHHLSHAVEEVRRISHNLHPSELDDLGLLAAVRSLGENFEQRTGIQVTLSGFDRSTRVRRDVEPALYRIVQEALTNVEKHAGARRVELRCIRQNGTIQLLIRDDGRGFCPSPAPADEGRTGLGLISMRERAALVGGSVAIESAPAAGTTIRIEAPDAGSEETAARLSGSPPAPV